MKYIFKILLLAFLFLIGGCNEDLPDPKVTTDPAVSITNTSATIPGGTDNGGSVKEVGVCWSTTNNPKLSNDKVVCSYLSGGLFFGYLTNLSPNTQYFVRAYAIHKQGTFYGNEVSFTTTN